MVFRKVKTKFITYETNLITHQHAYKHLSAEKKVELTRINTTAYIQNALLK